MKLAKQTLAVLLALVMAFSAFSVVGSAKHNAEATIEPIGNNGKINATGTVTYGLDVYKVTGDGLEALEDGAALQPGDVVEVQLCFGTDFYAGLISTPIWYDSTYFEPYAEGDVYPYKPGNAFAPDGKPIEEKGDGTDIPYFKLLEENAIPAETANGITATLFDTIAPADKQGYIGHIGKDAVEGTWKQWTPLTWRTFKNGKQLAGNPVAEEYLKYHLAGIALTMNADGGTGGWDIIVPYAAYFSFQLRVKEGADTNGSADASIFIAMESAKRATNETCNRLYATECPDGEYTTAQGTATYGQGYDLTNADREFVIGEAAGPHEHSYTLTGHQDPTCTEDGYDEYTCSCGDSYRTVITKLNHNYQVTATVPATCTEAGKTTYTCSRCQDSYDVPIDALNHLWGAWTTVTAPTTEADGLEQRECSRCHEVETNVLPKIQLITVTDDDVSVTYPETAYDGEIELVVNQLTSGAEYNLVAAGSDQFVVYDVFSEQYL